MQNCENILDLLNQYIDGELDESDAERVRAHIEECESCKRVYGELVRVNKLLEESEVEAPAELLEGVLQKIKVQKAVARRRAFRFGTVAAAAVIAVGVFASPLVMRMGYGAKEDAVIFDQAEALAPSKGNNSGGLSEAVDEKSDYNYSEIIDAILGVQTEIDTNGNSVLEEAEDVETEPSVYEFEQGKEYVFIKVNGDKAVAVFEDGSVYLDGEKYDYKINGSVVMTNGAERLVFKWDETNSAYRQVGEQDG